MTAPTAPEAAAPADAARPLTERVLPEYSTVDRMSVREIAATMNDADSAVSAAVRDALPVIAAAIDAASARFQAGGRLIYAGAGTSGRLGVLDAAECPPTFHTGPDRVIGLIAGGRGAMFEAVEGAEDDSVAGAADIDSVRPGPLDTVVGITASGNAPYVLGALRAARSAGCLTVALSCTPSGLVASLADHSIEVLAGAEVLAGSTRLKAGTAQKQVLNMISTIVMIRAGRTYGNLMVDLRVSNAKLTDRALRIITRITGVGRERAETALREADLEVKTAVVILIALVSAPVARRMLAEADGRLARVIGPMDAARAG